MICAICKKQVVGYNPKFNQLEIGKFTADICGSCIDAVVKLQQKNLATLFPTTQAKKWVKRNK